MVVETVCTTDGHERIQMSQINRIAENPWFDLIGESTQDHGQIWKHRRRWWTQILQRDEKHVAKPRRVLAASYRTADEGWQLGVCHPALSLLLSRWCSASLCMCSSRSPIPTSFLKLIRLMIYRWSLFFSSFSSFEIFHLDKARDLKFFKWKRYR